MGVFIFQVVNQLFKLSLGPLGCKVGKLGFKATNEVCCSIGNFTTELKDSFRFALKGLGEALGIWVKTYAQHAALGSPCRLELLVKGI